MARATRGVPRRRPCAAAKSSSRATSAMERGVTAIFTMSAPRAHISA